MTDLAHAPQAAAADDDHDRGLLFDLQTLQRQATRRRALRWLTGAGAGAALAAGGAARAADLCSLIPEETAGPYPGDGSNNAAGGVANVLALGGIVRRDIRSSIGSATGTAAGLPLQVRMSLVNTNGGCASLAGYAIYLWHCTRDGLYSMYSQGVTNQNYLRGVQVTDSAGAVVFDSIFPGCYAGRMPHIHFEVYRNTSTATSFTNKLRTSQIALPVALCQTVYNKAEGYTQSVSNLSHISFDTDMVFSDGYSTQLASVVDNARQAGVTVSLQVGISV